MDSNIQMQNSDGNLDNYANLDNSTNLENLQSYCPNKIFIILAVLQVIFAICTIILSGILATSETSNTTTIWILFSLSLLFSIIGNLLLFSTSYGGSKWLPGILLILSGTLQYAQLALCKTNVKQSTRIMTGVSISATWLLGLSAIYFA